MRTVKLVKNWDRLKKGQVFSHHPVVAERLIRRGIAVDHPGQAPFVTDVQPEEQHEHRAPAREPEPHAEEPKPHGGEPRTPPAQKK